MAASLFKRILKHCLAAFMVLGLAGGTLAVVSVNAASATSIQQEGQDGNNLVCGGVHTHAMLMHIINGGSVRCANGTVERGIGKIWEAMGITPQIAARMKLGTVCSNQGYISSGRQMGPDPSKNVRREVDGITYYTRLLSVWGPTCYQSWKAYGEAGQSDGIFTGCGNAVTTHYPPSGPPPVKKPAPVKTVACYLGTTPEYSVPAGYTVESGACVNVQQECATDNGSYNSVTGICTVVVATCSNVTPVNVTNSTNVFIYITNYGNCNTAPPAPPVVVTPPPVVVPPPPPVVTPPQPPTVYGLTLPENGAISIGGTSPVCAFITAPSGDSLSVTFTSATIGDFSSPTQTVTSAGTNTVCATYAAPTNSADYGSDTYTVSVYDSTTKLSALASSSTFTISPPPTRPNE